MTLAPLTWLECSAQLKPGSRVVFVTPHDIFPECVVAAGTTGTVVENGLNEMHVSLDIMPDDPQLQSKLAEWEGTIMLGSHLDPGADQDNPEDDRVQAWHAPSPLACV